MNPASVRARAFVAIIAMLAVLGLPATAPTAAASSAPALGLYPGPANVAGLNSFSNWLGAPVPYAVDFADHRHTWAEIERPTWLMDPWSGWVGAASGRRLVISVPLMPDSDRGKFAQGAAGDFDEHFRVLAQNLISRGLANSVVRLGWEMNNAAFPWYAGTDTQGYIAYFRRVVGVMRSVPGGAFTIDWCPLAGLMANSPLTAFSQFYPGDDVVDIIGLDNYDLKWQDTTSSPATRWDWQRTRKMGLNDHRDFAAAHGKPLSFPEWGLYSATDEYGGGGDSPYFIDRMADWFSANPTNYQSYFNLDWGGGTLDTFPNAKARYKARFGAGSTAPTTTTLAPTTTTSAPTTTTSTLLASSWSTKDETIAVMSPAATWRQKPASGAVGGDYWASTTTGASATLTFTGTGVRYTGRKQADLGIAHVYLDNVKVAEVDTYSAATLSKQVLFEVTGLSAGRHTLQVVTSGQKNVASNAPWLHLDDWQVRT